MEEKTLAGFPPATFRIVLTPSLVEGYTDEPARKHKRRRIQKKWLKRYGYKPKVNPNIFLTAEGMAVMHPETFRKFVKALGSEKKAEEAIYSYFTGGKKHG